MIHRLEVLTAILVAAALLLPASSARADAGSSCARVSVFDAAPRKQKLYPAVLIEIDGSLPGPMGSESYRIAPGRHTLKVAEAIDSRQFIAAQNRDRDGRSKHDRYKTLQIDAEAGMTYFVAARFLPEQRHLIREGGYWEPVVWKTQAVPCG